MTNNSSNRGTLAAILLIISIVYLAVYLYLNVTISYQPQSRLDYYYDIVLSDTSSFELPKKHTKITLSWTKN